jgi:mannosyl-glycoprotein endo-beta-N-acetylglucosaminidase
MINFKKHKITIGATLFFLYLLFKKKNYNTNMSLTSTQQKFINTILPASKVIQKNIGVPYQFIIAQICIESNFGKSSLTSKYFNYGGIKAIAGLPSVKLLTTECINGVCSKVYQNFAVFPNPTEGLMYQTKIYSNKYFKKYLNITTDPYEYVKLLQSGTIKYATSPTYVQTISKMLDKIIAAAY